jgi:hypothetical protein
MANIKFLEKYYSRLFFTAEQALAIMDSAS